MIKIIYRLFISLTLIITLIVIYLSIIGIKTDKFNHQITSKVREINSNLDLKLNQVNIKLNPLSFTVDLKTLGTDLSYQDNIIQLENLKSQISLKSIFKNEFAISELAISTKSISLKDLIILVKEVKNYQQLFIANEIIDKGYIVADLKFEFNEVGNIKDNFIIKGLVNNAELTLSNKKVTKLNFIFQANNKELNLEDLTFLFNNKNLDIPKLNVKKNDDNFLVTGRVKNKDLNFEKNEIKTFLDNEIINKNLNNLSFNSESNFKFNIDNNLKIKNLDIQASVNVNKLDIDNFLGDNYILPNIKKNLVFENQQIKINYNKSKIEITGSGNIFIQNNLDVINYQITNIQDNYLFNLDFEIEDNPLILNFINFEKDVESSLSLKLKGALKKDKLEFDHIILTEDKNIISIENLQLSKDFKIEELETINLNYEDRSKLKNELKLKKDKNTYVISGASFNADHLITELLKSNEDNKKKFFSKNFELKINVKKVYLDANDKIDNLKGKIFLSNNEVVNLNLESNFSNNKKITLTVRENNGEKITTLFSDEAKPLVDRYKFIKGFTEGKLDFYSTKKNNQSKSNLKIYDFKLKELPALTKILSLASLQGIADLLSGEGIRFSEFEMNFDNKADLMTINEIYAIGPAISILMEGYVEKDNLLSLRGTLVPATTINKTIGSIPLIGNILVGQKVGEGVFGVSFKIKGPPKDLETTVNPIKTLTPRFITRTLEKIKKN
ncbi:AsmA-like C-terminal region-containing protein [Candidatus Pelagibacter bacterium]|nr:AsmA-like C-terminal region-containing protein [Candidatus Pelagibacter bacterium]